MTAIPASAAPSKAMPKDPLANVVDLDGPGNNGLSPFREDGGDRSMGEKKEGDMNGGGNGNGMFPRKRRREENYNNFVGHEIIDGEDEDDGKDAHLDELMDGLEAPKRVVLSDSEPSDGMPSESDDDDDPDGREVVDLSDGEYHAPGEYVPVAKKKAGTKSS